MHDRVLILTPHGRDASVAKALLQRHGIAALSCGHLTALFTALEEGAGAALVAEEALTGAELDSLSDWLDRQPPWSDLPFVVLTNGHKGARSARAFETLDRLRNLVLLERPLHAESLVRAIRSALNTRRRQYEARDIMDRSREELERLVVERTREREAALAQLHEAQKLETIGQLTGGVAHDFNNLLTPVMGNLDMLRRRLPAEDVRSHRLLDNALHAASRAATLVQRLLAFARRQDLQPRAVDVSNLLSGMEDLIARSIGPTVAVSVNAPQYLPAARVDPGQLELAILNLALNARDAMPDGGKLTMSISFEDAHSARSRGLDGGGFIRICVADSGVGMDALTLKRAVEPFFSTKGVGKGTGLGLSMVHGLAAQSGGTLTLSSVRGQGTTVELWLPLAEEAASAIEPVQGNSILAARPATVLLVDDEELVRVVTAEMLVDLGYCVIQAGSGTEALSLLRADECKVDMLVTDYLMPGMSGADVVREARRIKPDLPALLLTGYTNLAQGPGAELARLTKPFRQAELAARMADILDAARARSSEAACRG